MPGGLHGKEGLTQIDNVGSDLLHSYLILSGRNRSKGEQIMASRSSNFDCSFHMLPTFRPPRSLAPVQYVLRSSSRWSNAPVPRPFSPRRNCTTSDSEQTPYTSTPSTTAASGLDFRYPRLPFGRLTFTRRRRPPKGGDDDAGCGPKCGARQKSRSRHPGAWDQRRW